MSEAIVSIQGVSKHFGAIRALDDISIDIKPGEIFALLGPSGCGKSTLLRVISGFEVPTDGRLIIDGQDMSKTPPNKRPVNMVFQSYAVFPHMSVADNVAYGLKMDKVPRGEIDERVDNALKQVHLEAFKTRMPDQLSGGQRQRVALARALVTKVQSEPEVEGCPLHPMGFHTLAECRSFFHMEPAARHELIKDKNCCFRCCGMHWMASCPSSDSCDTCRKNHQTLLHEG